MEFCLEQKLNWLYVDINSYFATIEQQLNPDLRYKPIAVVPLLADSTCAIAASYEAKKYGISTGTRIYEAKKLCPELICIPARHQVYVEYHRRIFDEIDLHLKVDHIFSIDEGACKLTGKYCNAEEAVSIARQIKRIIQEKVGEYITCSIGIAPNRYLAKIASNMQKPDGLIVITPDDLPNKLYALSLRDLPGIGKRTESKIRSFGINSVKHLCQLEPKRLRSIWGNVWGEKIWYLLRGADLPLEQTKKNTIGHSKVLAPELRNVESARIILLELVLKAANRLREKELYAGSLLLVISTASKGTIKESTKIAVSSDNRTLLSAVTKSWDSLIARHNIKEVKKISISLHNLQEESKQLSFDGYQAQKKQERLSRIIDLLNKKLGANTVTLGILPKKHKTKAVVAFGYIPDIEH